MKRFLLVLFLTTLALLPADWVLAQPQTQTVSQEDYFGLPLCQPGGGADETCLVYGPAQKVMELKDAGFPYPLRDLPAATPSAELNTMPVFIAKINLPEDQPAPVYTSFEDAVAGVNPFRSIEAGDNRYVSYIDRREAGGRTIVQLASGGWTPASPAASPRFQGLVFSENPRNDFGWIVDQTPSYQLPSFGAGLTGKEYYRENLIQVYDTIEAEGYFWYLIAPGEWINSQKARVVTLRPDPPEGVPVNRWIELDLFQQTFMIYEDGHLVFATLMTSGREPFYTKPGVFTIYEKKALADMLGSFEADRSDYYFFGDVPWQMYYDEARAIHTAYWRTNFGYVGSHGCVNLSPGDAQWAFLWADEGDYVWVHDPSGMTPTDSEYDYGRGAP